MKTSNLKKEINTQQNARRLRSGSNLNNKPLKGDTSSPISADLKKENDCPECKKRYELINQALSTQKQEFEKLIDEIENPYPTDIFPKLTQIDLDKINALLEQVLKLPLDRLSAELMRRARETLKEDLKQKLGDK